jgi:hypothetical protein
VRLKERPPNGSGHRDGFVGVVRDHGRDDQILLDGATAWRSDRSESGRTLGLYGGLITAGLGLGHLGGVAVVELRRSPVQYDFRVYALLLLGVTPVVLGTRLA